MAKIDGFENWSAKAAAMYAFECIEEQSPFIALFLNGDEKKVGWAKANCSFEELAALAAYLNEMVTVWARENINNSQ